MLRIKTKLDKSQIAGIGVFTDEDIHEGQIIWSMNNLSVFRITSEDYKSLSEEEKKFYRRKRLLLDRQRWKLYDSIR